MVRCIILLMGLVAAMVMLTGRAHGIDIVQENREYLAYGKKWQYLSVEHHTQEWGVNTGHGIIGLVDKVKQTIILGTESGEKIPVHDRLYALQKDGSYRKIKCCDDFSTLASVYSFDDKLFVHFLQRKGNVTDCFVYPAYQPDNEKLPSEKQINWIDFYGEFDLEKKAFYVNSFYPGIDSATKEKMNWKEWYGKASIEEATKVEYQNRAPFDCNK